MNAKTDIAVEVLNAGGMGQVCLLCEHASSFIPAEYADLGLVAGQRQSHAVWDPGALDLAQCLSAALDAPLVASRISRLVYDCNRPPQAKSACAEQSEKVDVPGNRSLSESDRKRRVQRAYTPFCQAVSELLDARQQTQQRTVLVTVHSFSPRYFDSQRRVEIGVLHDSDARLADRMLALSSKLSKRVV